MRIACPSCHAQYEVPDAMLAGGVRQLRCARCGHGFRGAVPAEAAPPPPIPAPPLAEPATAPEPDQPAAASPLAEVPSAEPPAAAPPADKLAAPVSPEPAPVSLPVSAPGSGPDRPPPTRGPLHHSPIDPPEDPPEDPPPPAPGRLAAAWLGSLALVGAGVAALVVFQAEIAAAWPPAARLYVALGLG